MAETKHVLQNKMASYIKEAIVGLLKPKPSNRERIASYTCIGIIVLAIVGTSKFLNAYKESGAAQAQKQARMNSTADPVEFADLYFGDDPAKDNVRTRLSDEAVEVVVFKEETLTPNFTRSQFLYKTIEFMPRMLSRFDVSSVTLTYEAEFFDERGRGSRQKALSATFDKENASSIVWDRIKVENIPKLADRFYIHPGLARQIADGEW